MLPATKLRQFDLLAQLRASCAIARPARIGMLGNLCGISETPCWLLPFNLFYEAEMVTVLAQLAAHASHAIVRAACIRTLWNLYGISAIPCRSLLLSLFYEAEMVTVLAQLAARASRVAARAALIRTL